MADDCDTYLIEFRGPADADESDSPTAAFEAYLQSRKRTFTAEEFVLSREDVKDDPEWQDWHAENPDKKLLAAVFFVPAEEKSQFDALVAEFMSRYEPKG